MNSLKYVLLILVCLLQLAPGYAQTCTGSLGDPIINVDFGAGSTSRAGALGSGITNYTYTTATPQDGFYTITQSTAGMYNTWWVTTDHTGNAGGYMMVVNASVSKTDYFYKQAVSGLCPGTTYEFAAWLMNVVKTSGISPNITFTILNAAGNAIKTFSTGDIAITTTPTWAQYGTYFTTPVGGGDITLVMTNNAAGGNGNDIALDDITFRACGPVITSGFIANPNQTLTACVGDNQSYTLTSSAATGYNIPAYQWQTNINGTWVDIAGANSTAYTTPILSVAGLYQYRMASAELINMASANCRVVSNVLAVTVNALPSTVITGSPTVCEGQQLSLSVPPADSYSWTGPNGFTSNQQQILISDVTLANAGDYNVTVFKANCSATGKATVTVNPKVVANAGSDITICEGTGTQLQATGGVTYIWLPVAGLSDPNIANPMANPASNTTYTVTVSNAAGCSATASVTVNVTHLPVANAGEDQVMTEGQAIVLNGAANGDNFYWTPSTNLSNPNSLQPTATPTQDITYTLHTTTGSPCYFEASDEVFIRVYKKVVIPNTFTPNNDGVNDTWGIIALNTYPNALTQVFNRNGGMVFQTQGYSKAWDGTTNGKPLPVGTYYYKIDLKNGKVLSGWVAILR